MERPFEDRPEPERPPEDESVPDRHRRPEDTALWVDLQIRAAMARGEFDDLPYAGQPLPEHLTSNDDPDWWLKGLIERERITGVLPEALQLRKDDADLQGRLDRIARPDDVREAVTEFNRRVVEARRQLAGGPPVVTPLRDVESEVAGWFERRRRRSAQAVRTAPATSERSRRRWFRRGP